MKEGTFEKKMDVLRAQGTPEVKDFQQFVLSFYRSRGREFPWRATRDPYAILVSEIMLQQTQTDRVVPKYEAFLKEFPCVEALSKASVADVVRMWMGLGYYRRALNLHKAAKVICEERGGDFPTTIQELRSLPGVGSYTAAAVGAFAFGIAAPMIETNIRSVYLTFFFPKRRVVTDKEVSQVVEETLYRRDPRRWFYALMDLGVELKRLDRSINTRSKHYVRQSKFHGSHRQVRAAVLKTIAEKSRRFEEVLSELSYPQEKIELALTQLEREGFVIKKRSGLFAVPMK